MAKITIKQIAKIAKVTKSTVSKALNGQKGVSDKNRERIISIAKKMQYQPNATARALARSITGIIGFVMPNQVSSSFVNSYWSELIVSITHELEKKNYNLMIITPSETSSHPFQTLENVILQNSVDGLIIGAEVSDTNILKLIDKNEIPFVYIGQNQFFPHYSIDINNEEAAYNLTKELIFSIQKQKRSICFLTGPQNYQYTQERIAGFTKALKESENCDFHIYETDYTSESIQKQMATLFEECPSPDALFLGASGDFFLTTIELLKINGIDSKRIIFSVFDDSSFFNFFDFKIIAAKQPLKQMGELATQTIFNLIDSKTPETKVQVLPVKIILR